MNDLRIIQDLNKDKLNTKLTNYDLILAPNIFSNYSKHELYNKLIDEIKQQKTDNILLNWNGNAHLILDEKYIELLPTFKIIIDTLQNFFNIKIIKTRLNYYNNTHWKPFHCDSYGQNITISLSLGNTRNLLFKKHDTNTTICIPQIDSNVYAFTKLTNLNWLHSVEKNTIHNADDLDTRISIICWGII